MRELTPAQRKALSEFANTVAAAWFSAGVISPFFTKPEFLLKLFVFISVGLLMTWAMLRFSLFLVEDIKL